jgi:periplasmic divalent cation tolerance protein
MSPYPMDPIDATGPMRIVVTALPDTPAMDRLVAAAVERRLAACVQLGAVSSRYLWKGRLEQATERVAWFKTSPKRVGALFRFLAEHHPYEVPEILEIDVARVDPRYLAYLAETLDADAPPPPLGGGRLAKLRARPGGRRGRAARAPGRTRAQHRRP